jgi:hypothetical protein
MMIPLLVTFGLLLVGLALTVYRTMRRQAEIDDRIHDRMRLYVGTGARELPQVAIKPLYKIERADEPEEAVYDRYSVSDLLPDWITVQPSDDELSAWRLLRHQNKETTDKA